MTNNQLTRQYLKLAACTAERIHIELSERLFDAESSNLSLSDAEHAHGTLYELTGVAERIEVSHPDLLRSFHADAKSRGAEQ